MDDLLLAAIKQDFYLIKTLLSDNFKLSQYLRIDFADALTTIDHIKIARAAAENNLKKTYLNKIYFILDDALYKMITPGKLSDALKTADLLVFLTCIHIKTITQKVKKKTEEAPIFDPETFEIKEIIALLPVISKNYPDSTMYLRLITSLLKKYKDTTEEMNRQAQIGIQKNKEQLINTYQHDLVTIISSIKKQYYNLILSVPKLKEEFEERYIIPLQQQEVHNPLDTFYEIDFTHLRHHLLKELAEFSKIRSCLLYIKKEGLDVLSTIRDLYNQQKSVIALCTAEDTALFNVMSDNQIPVSDFNQLSATVDDEMINYINAKFVLPYSH